MQVSRVGDSWVVELPDSVIEEFGLKEGDEVQVRPLQPETGRGSVSPASISNELAPKLSREEALAGLRTLRFELPADYEFDREEANAR